MPGVAALTEWGWEEEEEGEAVAEAVEEAGQGLQTAGFASGVHQLHRSKETNHSDFLGSLISSENQLPWFKKKNSTN